MNDIIAKNNTSIISKLDTDYNITNDISDVNHDEISSSSNSNNDKTLNKNGVFFLKACITDDVSVPDNPSGNDLTVYKDCLIHQFQKEDFVQSGVCPHIAVPFELIYQYWNEKFPKMETPINTVAAETNTRSQRDSLSYHHVDNKDKDIPFTINHKDNELSDSVKTNLSTALFQYQDEIGIDTPEILSYLSSMINYDMNDEHLEMEKKLEDENDELSTVVKRNLSTAVKQFQMDTTLRPTESFNDFIVSVDSHGNYKPPIEEKNKDSFTPKPYIMDDVSEQHIHTKQLTIVQNRPIRSLTQEIYQEAILHNDSISYDMDDATEKYVFIQEEFIDNDDTVTDLERALNDSNNNQIAQSTTLLNQHLSRQKNPMITRNQQLDIEIITSRIENDISKQDANKTSNTTTSTNNTLYPINAIQTNDLKDTISMREFSQHDQLPHQQTIVINDSVHIQHSINDISNHSHTVVMNLPINIMQRDRSASDVTQYKKVLLEKKSGSFCLENGPKTMIIHSRQLEDHTIHHDNDQSILSKHLNVKSNTPNKKNHVEFLILNKNNKNGMAPALKDSVQYKPMKKKNNIVLNNVCDPSKSNHIITSRRVSEPINIIHPCQMTNDALSQETINTDLLNGAAAASPGDIELYHMKYKTTTQIDAHPDHPRHTTHYPAPWKFRLKALPSVLPQQVQTSNDNPPDQSQLFKTVMLKRTGRLEELTQKNKRNNDNKKDQKSLLSTPILHEKKSFKENHNDLTHVIKKEKQLPPKRMIPEHLSNISEPHEFLRVQLKKTGRLPEEKTLSTMRYLSFDNRVLQNMHHSTETNHVVSSDTLHSKDNVKVDLFKKGSKLTIKTTHITSHDIVPPSLARRFFEDRVKEQTEQRLLSRQKKPTQSCPILHEESKKTQPKCD